MAGMWLCVAMAVASVGQKAEKADPVSFETVICECQFDVVSGHIECCFDVVPVVKAQKVSESYSEVTAEAKQTKQGVLVCISNRKDVQDRLRAVARRSNRLFSVETGAEFTDQLIRLADTDRESAEAEGINLADQNGILCVIGVERPTFYTSANCQYCPPMKAYLDSRGIKYREVTDNTGPVPRLEYRGQVVQGWDQNRVAKLLAVR